MHRDHDGAGDRLAGPSRPGLDRRRWLRLAGVALGGGWAAGCSTAGAARWTWSAPARARVTPALVSPDRVIRVVAGLRPYRPEGFVVRAESFDEKLLVHNYGHGGGGVSLSWGTAEMAADLVDGVGAGEAAVIGAGAVGLATARLLQRRGRAVTIYARDLPPNTTSDIAGAQWSPTSVSDSLDGPFGSKFERAARLAHRHFQSLVGPDYGVRWIDNYFPSDRRMRVADYQSRIRDLYPEWEDLEGDEHPFPTRYARRVGTMFIEPPRYLRALLRDFRIAGGRVVVGEIEDLSQLAALTEPVIVNCTGLGAKALFGDGSLVPVKGQLVVLRPQPEVDYLTVGGGRFSTEGSQYMFPRSDGILLGGTFERGVESLEPDNAQTERILRNHRMFFQAMEDKRRAVNP
ncbi:MAG: FAD-dependent oxidoreductase [Gemmatimonadetes bacterium]|nr:FAD-dependent oxidoreductase [Gemmatimonadota bacterium]MCY3679633.1 FAD-dependent oxidoreductase [Gemmatimonadota bacterium]